MVPRGRQSCETNMALETQCHWWVRGSVIFTETQLLQIVALTCLAKAAVVWVWDHWTLILYIVFFLFWSLLFSAVKPWSWVWATAVYFWRKTSSSTNKNVLNHISTCPLPNWEFNFSWEPAEKENKGHIKVSRKRKSFSHLAVGGCRATWWCKMARFSREVEWKQKPWLPLWSPRAESQKA